MITGGFNEGKLVLTFSGDDINKIKEQYEKVANYDGYFVPASDYRCDIEVTMKFIGSFPDKIAPNGGGLFEMPTSYSAEFSYDLIEHVSVKYGE